MTRRDHDGAARAVRAAPRAPRAPSLSIAPPQSPLTQRASDRLVDAAPTSRKRLVALFLALAVAVAVGALGCPGTRGAGRGTYRGPPKLGEAPPPVVDEKGEPVPDAPPPIEIVREERRIDVVIPLPAPAPAPAPAPEGAEPPTKTASLGALLVKPREGKGPAILVVPGGSDISRNGTRTGDGTALYAKPIDVHVAWAEAFARRGGHVLLWDKRTCGPNDDPACAKNPQDDIDAEGPAAMAKDVDAACALARSEPGYDGRLVLFAHGQAAQVALSAQCAQDATAIVLIAPIPRAIDEVMVAALRDRAEEVEKRAKAEKDEAQKAALTSQADSLKNAMGKAEAEFVAVKKDKFVPTATLKGATIAFWKAWIELTGRTAQLVQSVKTPQIVVVGERDLQYSEKDRDRIRALAPNSSGGGAIEVEGADHHLLTGGTLAESTVDVVGAALDKVLVPPES